MSKFLYVKQGKDEKMTFKKWQESKMEVRGGKFVTKNEVQSYLAKTSSWENRLEALDDLYASSHPKANGFCYEDGVIGILGKKYWVIIFNNEKVFKSLEEAERWLWEEFVQRLY
jgi:hypothetical protein